MQHPVVVREVLGEVSKHRGVAQKTGHQQHAVCVTWAKVVVVKCARRALNQRHGAELYRVVPLSTKRAYGCLS